MRWVLITASILGASSIIMGASLRHLGGDLDTDILYTALRYHQMHSVALLAFGLYVFDKMLSLRLIVPAALFIAGTLVFSGSLYLSQIFSAPLLAHLTPIGGIMLILAWLSLAFIKLDKT